MQVNHNDAGLQRQRIAATGWNEVAMPCLETLHSETRSMVDQVLVGDDTVLRNLLDMEASYLPASPIPSNFQRDILPEMREILSEWMFSVCEEEGCRVDVFLSAMGYLDRFLNRCVLQIRRSQLQLLGAVTLFIAAKVKDTGRLSAMALSYYTDYTFTADEIREWELNVLQVLNWDVSFVTAVDFLDLILARLSASDTSERQKISMRHAQTLIALCNISKNCQFYLPSMVAAASIAETARMTMNSTWKPEVMMRRLQDIVDCDADLLSVCQEQISEATRKRFSILSFRHEKESNSEFRKRDEDVNTPADASEIRLKSRPSPAGKQRNSTDNLLC